MGMIKKFLGNEDGNYAVLFAVAALPIFGAVGVATDYSNLSRLNFNLSDSVDSMCTVVAREYLAGKSSADVKLSGENFFKTNIDPQYVSVSSATFVLPDDAGNTAKTLRCRGQLTYKPIFGPVMAKLMGGNANDYVVVLNEATMKMKNLAEVALVMDNSGSMEFANNGLIPSDANTTRLKLLKDAAKKLVTDLITVGNKIQQTSNPVKFSIVPFAQAVNVGPSNASASWMDTTGISPIHHEHLNWGTKSTVTVINPTGYKTDGPNGSKLDAAGNPLTRFSIFNALQVRNVGTEVATQCAVWKSSTTSTTNDFTKCGVLNRTLTTTSVPPVTGASNPATYSWKGCVEARPSGYDLTDAVPTSGAPATLFVPLFAPDNFNISYYGSTTFTSGVNNWWPDYETKDATPGYLLPGSWNNNNTTQVASSSGTSAARARETDVYKYFVVKPFTATGSSSRPSQWSYFINPNSTTRSVTGNVNSQVPTTGTFGGPNSGCTTQPITPLTGSIATLTAQIDAMAAFGGTNSAEGLAWGWRTLTPGAPFTEGTSRSNKGMDRVVILLTDGANQLGALSSSSDYASNKSNYAAYGHTGYTFTSTPGALGTSNALASSARVFTSSGVSSPAFSSASYQVAIDARMAKICDNVKGDDMILMTVGLDLKSPADDSAVTALSNCAGTSKTRKDSAGNPKKLFWNATSTTLEATFKEIADELSNLRFTQ